MKQATNRYQIDAISKGIKQIEDQYSMAFENAMNAYNDTRDTRILDEWLKVSKEYEENITKVTEEWAKKIVAGKTY
jgi:L-rhamnose isomerase